MSRSTKQHATARAEKMTNGELRDAILDLDVEIPQMTTTEFDDKRAVDKARTRREVYFSELRDRLGAAPQLVTIFKTDFSPQRLVAHIVLDNERDGDDLLEILEDLSVNATAERSFSWNSTFGTYTENMTIWFQDERDLSATRGAVNLISKTNL